MTKNDLINLAKTAAQGEPISRYSTLEWSATCDFLNKLNLIIRADEREACAKMLELKTADLLLMAGEMTAQEKRTVKAVLAGLASKIRNRD